MILEDLQGLIREYKKNAIEKKFKGTTNSFNY